MPKKIKNALSIALIAYGSLSFVYVLAMYFFPFIFVLCSFVVANLGVYAYAERQYYLLFICFIICLIFVMAGIGVKKNKKIFPILAIACCISDILRLIYFIVGESFLPLRVHYVLCMIYPFAIIVLLFIYFIAKKHPPKSTTS